MLTGLPAILALKANTWHVLCTFPANSCLNRMVTLKDRVDIAEEKSLAAQLASNVDGVTEVVNELSVKS